uniref:tRNA (carboxymethyluridine(34)-5-O)-methyltransferase ALKBH8 n=1 Tax=Pavo cristatus TaxID=9049 RepID=A0A8C9F5P4_PAVCR
MSLYQTEVLCFSGKHLLGVVTSASQMTSMETGENVEDHLRAHKMKKKVLRKQVRAQHTLMRHEGIECVSHATQSLVIANAGLGNGMSRHQLHRIVENYGTVETLLMPPNKPYSFVKYESTEEAKKAFDALNGKEVTLEDSDQNIVLYCNFVEKGIILYLSVNFFHSTSLLFSSQVVNVAKSTLV